MSDLGDLKEPCPKTKFILDSGYLNLKMLLKNLFVSKLPKDLLQSMAYQCDQQSLVNFPSDKSI